MINLSPFILRLVFSPTQLADMICLIAGMNQNASNALALSSRAVFCNMLPPPKKKTGTKPFSENRKLCQEELKKWDTLLSAVDQVNLSYAVRT